MPRIRDNRNDWDALQRAAEREAAPAPRRNADVCERADRGEGRTAQVSATNPLPPPSGVRGWLNRLLRQAQGRPLLRQVQGRPPLWAEGITQGLQPGDARQVAAEIGDLPWAEREPLLRVAAELITPDMPAERRNGLLYTLRRDPAVLNDADLVRQLSETTWGLEGSEWLMMVVQMLATPNAERASVVASARHFFTADMSAQTRCIFVRGLAPVPEAEHPSVLECALALTPNASFQDSRYHSLIGWLARIPRAERPRVVQLTRALSSHVSPPASTRRALAVVGTVEILSQMTADAREAFAGHLAVARVLDIADEGLIDAFRALARVPPAQRASVAHHAAAFYMPACGNQGQIIVLLGRVAEPERADFVALCQQMRDAVTREDLPILMNALAHTPAAERAQHAERLRRRYLRPDDPHAATGAPVRPAVNLENVMDHTRIDAASAATQRLRLRFPSGLGEQDTNVQALVQHVNELAPASALSAAQQQAQWAAFAQHMADMPPTANAPLQQLASTLAAANAAPKRVPSTWLAPLAGFAKGVSFVPMHAHEPMSRYHPPQNSRATLLASWLGHLGQFAYLSRDSSAPQTDRDRQIEAFVAHVRRFEVSTLPVLTRVRGRTQATERENALRTLTGASRPGDYSEAVTADRQFTELTGLVWQAIAAAPEQDRHNMQHSLVLALAQCIEDDGHRVCGVGQQQRFVNVVEAQALTPSQKLTALSEEFAKEHAEPSAAQVRNFETHALGEAAALYGAGSPDLQDFTQQLRAYLQLL